MKQCLECGAVSSDDAMFCSVCGKKFPDAVDILAPENNEAENEDTHNIDGGQKIISTMPHEIVPLLQRVTLFLEDGELGRADEYCERILDIEPTNAEAYLDKLLIEFLCTTREELKQCNMSIAKSKNYAKVLRFGDDEQRAFVINAEKAIQAEISRQTEIKRIAEEATENSEQERFVIEEDVNKPDWQEAESDGTEETYVDITCPYCREELSYTNWQIKAGELICPMCDGRFVYDEGMKI